MTPTWTAWHTVSIMLILILVFIGLSVGVYLARQFDKVLDKPEETVKEDNDNQQLFI